MKPLSELNHYELLEVAPDAGPSEIERAYRLIRSTYEEDSLATYGVLEVGESGAILERIDQAYSELVDPEARSRYDAGLQGLAEDEGPADMEIAMALETARARPMPAVASLDALDEEGDLFDGARLRRSRLQRGIDLDQIAQVTKINPSYLQFIEDERYEDLPAPVYVRGFVSAYARCIGLDASQVAMSYMERFQERTGDASSSRRRR